MDDYRIAQVSSTRNIVEVYVKETSSLSRYVRFLNYQFRKYRIPAMANMSVTLECPTTEYEKFEDPDVRKEDVRVKFHLVKKIEITHAKWVSDRSGTVTVLTANDSQLAQGNLWAPVPVRNITFNTPEQNFCPDPHLFKYLNQLITISNTLSRKLTYGPDAFNYGVEQQG